MQDESKWKSQYVYKQFPLIKSDSCEPDKRKSLKVACGQ